MRDPSEEEKDDPCILILLLPSERIHIDNKENRVKELMPMGLDSSARIEQLVSDSR